MKWLEFLKLVITKKPTWAAKCPQWAWSLLCIVAVALFAFVLLPSGATPPDELPTIFQDESGKAFATGWQQDDEQSDAIAASLEFPSFATTAAGQANDPLPDHVYQWEAYFALFARPPPCKDQNPIGSCVGFGTTTGVERMQAVQIVAQNKPFEFKHLCEEFTYAGSRHEIGQDRIKGDGSNGGWAAEWVKKGGMIPREVVGKYDLTKYDPERCRAWGRTGAPDDLEPIAREHIVGDITRVETWTQAKKCLASGYGISMCSDVGFNKPGTRWGYVDPATRDSRGICNANGQWNHCMILDGYHVDVDGNEYGHVENSWGPQAHAGPVGWGNPTTAGFWTSAETIQRMLSKRDSWAFSDLRGFPARKVDWRVMGEISRSYAARPMPKDVLSGVLPRLLNRPMEISKW